MENAFTEEGKRIPTESEVNKMRRDIVSMKQLKKLIVGLNCALAIYVIFEAFSTTFNISAEYKLSAIGIVLGSIYAIIAVVNIITSLLAYVFSVRFAKRALYFDIVCVLISLILFFMDESFITLRSQNLLLIVMFAIAALTQVGNIVICVKYDSMRVYIGFPDFIQRFIETEVNGQDYLPEYVPVEQRKSDFDELDVPLELPDEELETIPERTDVGTLISTVDAVELSESDEVHDVRIASDAAVSEHTEKLRKMVEKSRRKKDVHKF